MLLVEKHKIRYTNKFYSLLNELSIYSNNLYNQSLYHVKNHLEENEEWLFMPDVDKWAKQLDAEFNNYRKLPSATAQQNLRLLDRNLKSYRSSIKDYWKNPHKYTGRPTFPKFRPKGSQNLLVFTNQQVKIKGNKLCFPKLLKGFTIKVHYLLMNLREVRIIPRNGYFIIELVYLVDDRPISESKEIAGIDLGLNNLITLVTSTNRRPLIINGKPLKSKNCYFNRQIDSYKSILKKTRNKYTSRKLNRLYEKREDVLSNEFHQISRLIVDYLVSENIGTVVIGHNKNQKQGSSLKNFVQLPIFKLIRLITYKCQLAGIKVIETEESYTSGTSFLDDELPIKENYNKNRRSHRGLFVTNNGQYLNSDVNAAYQILRKEFPDFSYSQNNIFNPHKITL